MKYTALLLDDYYSIYFKIDKMDFLHIRNGTKHI